MYKCLSFLFVVFFSFQSISQEKDSACFFCKAQTPNKKRITTVAAGEAVLYGTSLVGLNELWYKGYPRSSFHTFDDNKEWLQMDKAGHAITSYYIGVIGIDLMKWTGVKDNRALWYGGMLGTVYQSSIEILDGFSSQWGFSWGDLAANTFGSAAAVSQELLWKEQRIILKYSFHTTEYSAYRPGLLGKSLAEKMLKDYNGQTYWLSGNIASFIKKENRFPKWINVAIGYGANGMIGGKSNPAVDDNGNPYPHFERQRQYYFALDADLSKIKTNMRWFKTITKTFGFIKIPAPALSITGSKINFHPLYF